MSVTEPPFAPSVIARDLIGALSAASRGSLQYEAISTAGGAGGSVITTVRATGADGVEQLIEVAIGHVGE
ncbi:hypothetical protein [uncultured Jatrophihabitans sp.]|uniref:hypothetical protein n=1 Tax=uncultured Jatrophihabitans sp. TaxID=1610747 RepID=UPI0035CB3FC8